MGVVARKKAGSNIPPLPGGTYIATCCGVVDLGEQPNDFKKGQYQDKVLLIFEVYDEFVDVNGEQKPRWISKEYLSSLHPKAALRQDLDSWLNTEIDAEEFDTTEMVGDACQISVLVKTSKDGRERNEIGSIMSLVKGMPVPELISDKIVFDMRRSPEECAEAIELLPEWMREKIQKSPNWANLMAGTDEVDTADHQQSHKSDTKPKADRRPNW